MLKLVRRHVKNCPHKDKGRAWKKCSCPLWVDGSKDGVRVNRSLDTANWEIAAGKVLGWEASDPSTEISVAEACKKFYADCEGRKIKAAIKYKETLDPFKEFCTGLGISRVRTISLHDVEKFRNQLDNSALTVAKKVERLRTFFRYCLDREWCDKNPAVKVKKPVVPPTKKEPFTAKQWELLLDTTYIYPTQNSFGYDNRERMRAFIYLLRYSALRISDAVALKKERIDSDGRLFLRAAKNGKPVSILLPPFVLESLAKISNEKPYFFWSGNGLLKSAVADWQRAIIRLFRLAGVEGSAHRFRHTLSVELLSKGVSVENVAAILGDTEAIVRKHYAPWVKVRQDALDAAMMSVWQ
jgi:integrase/recombinase XerD